MKGSPVKCARDAQVRRRTNLLRFSLKYLILTFGIFIRRISAGLGIIRLCNLLHTTCEKFFHFT